MSLPIFQSTLWVLLDLNRFLKAVKQLRKNSEQNISINNLFDTIKCALSMVL